MWNFLSEKKKLILDKIAKDNELIKYIACIESNDVLVWEDQYVFEASNKEGNIYSAEIDTNTAMTFKRVVLLDANKELVAYTDTEISVPEEGRILFKVTFDIDGKGKKELYSDKLQELDTKIEEFTTAKTQIDTKHPGDYKTVNKDQADIFTLKLIEYYYILKKKMDEISEWFKENKIKEMMDDLPKEIFDTYDEKLVKLHRLYSDGYTGLSITGFLLSLISRNGSYSMNPIANISEYELQFGGGETNFKSVFERNNSNGYGPNFELVKITPLKDLNEWSRKAYEMLTNDESEKVLKPLKDNFSEAMVNISLNMISDGTARGTTILKDTFMVDTNGKTKAAEKKLRISSPTEIYKQYLSDYQNIINHTCNHMMYFTSNGKQTSVVDMIKILLLGVPSKINTISEKTTVLQEASGKPVVLDTRYNDPFSIWYHLNSKLTGSFYKKLLKLIPPLGVLTDGPGSTVSFRYDRYVDQKFFYTDKDSFDLVYDYAYDTIFRYVGESTFQYGDLSKITATDTSTKPELDIMQLIVTAGIFKLEMYTDKFRLSSYIHELDDSVNLDTYTYNGKDKDTLKEEYRTAWKKYISQIANNADQVIDQYLAQEDVKDSRTKFIEAVKTNKEYFHTVVSTDINQLYSQYTDNPASIEVIKEYVNEQQSTIDAIKSTELMDVEAAVRYVNENVEDKIAFRFFYNVRAKDIGLESDPDYETVYKPVEELMDRSIAKLEEHFLLTKSKQELLDLFGSELDEYLGDSSSSYTLSRTSILIHPSAKYAHPDVELEGDPYVYPDPNVYRYGGEHTKLYDVIPDFRGALYIRHLEADEDTELDAINKNWIMRSYESQLNKIRGAIVTELFAKFGGYLDYTQPKSTDYGSEDAKIMKINGSYFHN